MSDFPVKIVPSSNSVIGTSLETLKNHGNHRKILAVNAGFEELPSLMTPESTG
jgi:hypothetical protein